MTSIKRNEPPKPFVLSYGTPPPQRKASLVLWRFSFTAGVSVWGIVLALTLVISLIHQEHENVMLACCSGVFVGGIIAAIGIVVASFAHGLTRHLVGPSARSRSANAHATVGFIYAACSVAALYVMEKVRLAMPHGVEGALIMLSPTFALAAIAGFLLVGRDNRV